MKIFRENKSRHHKMLVGKKLTQYDAKGKRIATYLAISEAAKATGVHSTGISEALSGKQKSAGGYIWKKGWGKVRIDLSGYAFGEALRTQHKQIKIKQFTMQGKYIRTFPSVNAAAESIGIGSSNISVFLNGGSKHAGGFIWKKVGAGGRGKGQDRGEAGRNG